ncbi:protein FAR1-RELATED SEQUENCE 5-like isoform X2 [Rosa chinensis]|uniref:protein FAR1-RELATED SEQUENCE 5-like isoform X2 n=1 Tax=Rosa chinensis TaxID=74649 RepID=UPI001AD8B884|nr:protein FAR1-RELATED SEQUENCE 5-like isoform X2 [Rosa chinensis]
MEEIVGEDGELKPGMQVYSDDEAYNLYNNYALRKGFSIRKGHIRRDASGNVRLREFTCAKEGFTRDQDTFEQKRYKKLETRTGCKAMIVFTVADGIWTISHINSEHNHDLARPEERQFLKLGRKVLEAHGNVMLSMLGAGIPPTKSFFYLANEMGGPENVGFTKKDVHNFLQRKKNEMLEAGDGQSLFNHFKRKQDEDKAMAKEIGQVFPGTQHRLCTWHISKNAGKRIGSYLANPEFKKQFNKCLHGCSTETEFQASWDDMISRYNLGGNSWLEKLYSLREKWCPVFSLDTFSAKIRSTQRSESTNNVFHQISTHTMELIKFVHHYEKKIEEMRLAELEDDY